MQDGVSRERGEKREEGGERTGRKRREKLIRGKQNEGEHGGEKHFLTAGM